MKKLSFTFFLFLFITSSIFSQTPETEPNNSVGNSGIIVISAFGSFTGSVNETAGDAEDLWELKLGTNGSIKIDFTISGGGNDRTTLPISENASGYSISNIIQNVAGGGTYTHTYTASKYYLLRVNTHAASSYPVTYTITISDAGGGALSVELSSFNGFTLNGKVTLNWSTATEVNNHGFEILRKSNLQVHSSDSLEGYNSIGFVAGAGNSNSPKNYSFTDQPTDGTSFSYRLKQIDNDGKFKYYEPITVTLETKQTAELMQNSPNPFNPSTLIKFYIPQTQDVTIKIYDMLGREVNTLINKQTNAGYHNVYWNGRDINGTNVASGIYLYRLTAGNFVETKKMELLK